MIWWFHFLIMFLVFNFFSEFKVYSAHEVGLNDLSLVNMVLSFRAENPICPRRSCCCMYQLPMIHYALFHQNVMCQYSDATACRQTILRSTARSKFKSRGWSCQKIAHLSVKRGSFCLKKNSTQPRVERSGHLDV